MRVAASQALSPSRVELKMPLLGDPEPVELFCGSLPIGWESFQRLVPDYITR